MSTLRAALGRGILAGAAGTAALNTLTYLDMAIRARSAGDTPQRAVTALVDHLGLAVPGNRRQRADRVAGLGPLAGIAAGVAVGGLAGVLRAAGLRLPAALGGPLLGAAAMAVTDVSSAALGVTDPRSWSTAEWISDAVPHLGYGLTAHATLAATDEPAGDRTSTAGSFARSLAVGAAAGARSSAGFATVALATRGAKRKLLAGPLTIGELVLDKSTVAPSRLGPSGLPGRVLAAVMRLVPSPGGTAPTPVRTPSSVPQQPLPERTPAIGGGPAHPIGSAPICPAHCWRMAPPPCSRCWPRGDTAAESARQPTRRQRGEG